MKTKTYFSTAIVAFVICISQLVAQTNTCPAPAVLTSANITATTATLSWASVSNALTYNVRYRPYQVPNATWTTLTSQTTSVNITGLTPATQYEWQVRTGCSGLNGTITYSAYTQSALFTTLSSNTTCAVPTGLFTNNITSTSATTHWTSTGATSYRVRYRQVSTVAWTIVSASTNSKNLTGLTPSTAYEWQVRSRCVNANGTITFSAWSAVSVFQTLGTNTCPTPSGLTSTIGTAGNSVTLAWNSTSASSYNIRYRVTGSLAWTNTTSSTNSKTITGLNSGANYEWQVQGVCASGGVVILSAWSASAFFTTPAPVTISPNPADNRIMITYESSSDQNLNFAIRDFIGVINLSVTKTVTAGTNQIEINIAGLKNGIYYLEAIGTEGKETLKFYVQH
ncbi:MAG: fibronectin type III domain-containing protein [Bacteroidia bacterium]